LQAGYWAAGRGVKGSASFFAKKEAKKLLFAAGCGATWANAHRKQTFFGYFFSKKYGFLVFLNNI
jgi:hypothetical protein